MAFSTTLRVIEGAVALRRLAVNDLAVFKSYRNDPAVGRFQGWSPMTDTEAAAFLADVSTSPLLVPGVWSQVAIAAAESDALLGDIGVLVSADSSEAEIGFTVSPAAQRHRVATSAARAAIGWLFGSTPVTRVLGITDARNNASVGVLRRVGMAQVSSREVVFRGEPCTELIYAVERRGAA